MQDNKQRLEYLDVAKGIGMICVIAGHMDSKLINTIVFSFHMPLFFIISGYFAKKNTVSNEFKKKAKHLIIPYVFTCITVIIFALFKNLALGHYSEIAIETKRWILASFFGSGSRESYFLHIQLIGAIWFLLALFWASIIYSKLVDTKYSWLISIVLFLAAYVTAKKIWLPLSVLAGMSAVLFLNIGHHLRKVDFFSDNTNVKLLSCILVWLVCLIQDEGNHLSMVSCRYNNIACEIIGSIAGTCIIVFLSMKIEKLKIIGKMLAKYGRYSLIVMCFHLVELNTVPWYLLLDAIHLSNKYVRFISLFGFKILWSILAVTVVLKIPILSKIFGFRHEEKALELSC